MIKNYKQYNESVRDFMKPKSVDDIKSTIKGLSSIEKLRRGAQQGILWMVQEALDEGVDINSNEGIAIQMACTYGHIDMVKYLIEQGADVTLNDNLALRWACEGGRVEIMKVLLENGADINVLSITNMPTNFNKRKEIRELIRQYQTKNESVRDHMKPKSKEELNNIWVNLLPMGKRRNLIESCEKNKTDMVRFLLDSGLELDVITYKYCLSIAEEGGYNEIKYMLQDYWKSRRPIKKFKSYLSKTFGMDESVRDMMKPKSEEELLKLFKNMSEVELSEKELQAMQTIAQYYYLDNREEYIKTDIDYHKLFVDGEHMMYYISTGPKSIQQGFPPNIEGITISNGFTCFYVDVNSKFVGKEDDMETLIVTTFQNEYRDRLQVWNDMTMEDRIDDGLENIESGDVGKWYDYLVELFDEAELSAREVLPNESMG